MRTASAPGEGTDSSRISARWGPIYQRALPSLPSRAGTLDCPIGRTDTAPAISFRGTRGNPTLMLDRLDRPAGDAATTAPRASLAGRQALFFTLVAATIALLLSLAATALSAGGLGGFDIALLGLFAVTLPWSVIGFWNATIGFLIMRFARNPTAVVYPMAAQIRGDEPIRISTAIVIC